MKMKSAKYWLGLGMALAFVACVPKKKFTELTDKKQKADQEIEQLRNLNEKLDANNKECTTGLSTAKKENTKLAQDTAKYGKENRNLRDQVDNLSTLNDTLTQKMNTLLVASSKENKLLLDELKRKESALKVKEAEVKEKENAIAEREAKLQDLQRIMAAKDSAAQALRAKLSKALEAFRNKGLTVTEKDGKVYISMEAKLLFASGSTAVDAKGREAILEIAQALQDENEVEIIVEGHTDTDRINSSSIPRDNWELSVLRATEVVKIMSENSTVKPEILSAAGRSEFHPVDANDKSKNRRIEIIIQPSMKEIYQWIEKN
jgi:chemotaxis protein MotB